MTDYFALLEEPRRAWLDPEELKERFHRLSADAHPDRVHQLNEADRSVAQARFVELNAAYNCLRNPKDRLRHLLQLETERIPGDINQIPSELLELFTKVGQVCRDADTLLAGKEATSSPLLKVQWFQKSQASTDELLQLQQILNLKRAALDEQLRSIDKSSWGSDSSAESRSRTVQRLESILHLYGFYDRWIAQLHERVARLSF